jgi:hypothetical protein
MTDPNSQDALLDLPPDQRRKVAEAYGKLLRREKLSRNEEAAIQRFEKTREERLRWQYYRTIPKKHWRQMSGRQAKVINEQASRYALPLGGPKVDLPELVKALHDFLAKNAQRLASEDDPLLQTAQSSPALEAYRKERARLAQLDRMEREQTLMPREDVRASLAFMASLIRRATERLQRRYGEGAADLIRSTIDDFEREMEERFGEGAEEEEEEEG